MNTLNSLKYAAFLLPAMALGMPMANANDEECECPESERTTAAVDSERDYQRTDERQDPTRTTTTTMAATDEDENLDATTDTTTDTNTNTNRQFLTTKPDRGYHSDSLVGHEVVNRSTDESIGEVSDLVLDENGQVQAVIVNVGGVMGLGERDVAIAWDQLNRETEGDEVTLSVDLTEESLEDAPKYSNTQNQSRQ